MKVEEQRRLVALKKCYGKICRQGPAFALARDARSRLRKWTALMWSNRSHPLPLILSVAAGLAFV
jgi:hypothetical protein